MSGSTALTDGDFRIVNFVSGRAKTTHIFGIGGLKPTALVHEAKKDLYLNFPLEKGQAYANITVDFKRSFFPLVGTTIATVSADLVEFNPSAEEPDIFSRLVSKEKSLNQIGDDTPEYIKASESLGVLLHEEFKTMKLHERKGKNRYELISSDSVAYVFNVTTIFQIEAGVVQFNHRFDVGDFVEWIDKGESVKGTIIGVNPETAIIKVEDEIIEKQPDKFGLVKP